MGAFEYLGGNSPFTFPMAPMPAGTDTTHLVQLTYEQAVGLLWKVKSFKVSGANLVIPSNGHPYGGVTDSYADFIAPSIKGFPQYLFYPSKYQSGLDWSAITTPMVARTDSGSSFLISNPTFSGSSTSLAGQVFAGAAAENDLAPETSTSGATYNGKSCWMVWGPFSWAGDGSGNHGFTAFRGAGARMFYDRDAGCYWCDPPFFVINHSQDLYNDPFGWEPANNSVFVATTARFTIPPPSHPWHGETIIAECGNLTLNLWGSSQTIPLYYNQSANPLGTDGKGAGISAAVTVEIHEEWDYS